MLLDFLQAVTLEKNFKWRDFFYTPDAFDRHPVNSVNALNGTQNRDPEPGKFHLFDAERRRRRTSLTPIYLPVPEADSEGFL